mmetsp:Transcript_11633/g.14960  ORF Transcript_11633/g.14960 Transcript_11633/m.14960 type:complete len:1328 (-) Transcript_11633:11-3994(-)
MLERGIIGPDLQDFPNVLDDIWKYTADERELDDVQVYMRVMQEGVLGSFGLFEAARRRQPRTKYLDLDLYRRCVAYGLKPLARLFMCSAPELGEAMSEGGVVLPPTPKQMPNVLAAKYVKKDIPEINSIKRVMSAVRSMVAMELSCEPRIRKVIRDIYEGKKEFIDSGRGEFRYTGATLSTNVTDKGLKEIDFFHRYHGLQHIYRKPCLLLLEECAATCRREDEKEDAASRKFCDDSNGGAVRAEDGEGEEDPNDIRYHTGHAEARQTLYFRILEAKREGLLTYSIDPPLSRTKGDEYADFRFPFENAGALVATAKGTEVTEAWNGERLMLLEECIRKRLIPSFKAHMEKDIKKATKEAVIAGSVRKFRRKYLEVGPYQPPSASQINALKGSVSGGVKVVGVCISENPKHGHCFVALTEQGAVRDHLTLAAGKRREASKEDIENFLFTYQPHVIAVSTSAGKQAKTFAEFLAEINRSVTESHKKQRDLMKQSEDYDAEDFDEDEEPEAEVFLVPDELARIFASSPRSLDEFPDYQSSKNLLIAIALGRYIQEPLAEVSYLWSHGKSNKSGRRGEEALYLGLHPQADLIAKASLLRGLERELCISICESGVNLNAAVLNMHRQPMLSFVSGLGHIKAHDLINKIKKLRHSQVPKRSALKQLLGSKVFSNAAGFLRIRDYPNVHLNPIDDTRIHPETVNDHEWVRTMVRESCGDDDETRRARDNEEEGEWGELAKICMQRHRDAIVTAAESNAGEAGRVDWSEWLPRQISSCETAADFSVDDTLLDDPLGDLDLEAYAADVEASLLNDRAIEMKVHRKLQLIKNELRFPFLDRRQSFKGPNKLEEFEALTQETPSSFVIGSHHQVEVQRTDGRYGIFVRLSQYPSLGGKMHKSELNHYFHRDDDDEVVAQEMARLFPEGRALTASLVAIDIEKMRVMLSLNSKRLNFQDSHNYVQLMGSDDFGVMPSNVVYRPYLDVYANKTAIANDYEKKHRTVVQPEEAQKLIASRNAYSRVFHSKFVRLNESKAAIKLLHEEKTPGNFLVQPYKDKDGLELVWAFQPQILKAFTINEKDKKSPQELGETLMITYGANGSHGTETEEYESIDEIAGRFIERMNDLVREVTGHPITGEGAHSKFIKGQASEVIQILLNRVIPMGTLKTTYGVHIDAGHPGWFVLSMQEAHKPSPKQVFIRVTPEGFAYKEGGGRLFPTFDMFLHYFKKQQHQQQQQRQQQQQQRQQQQQQQQQHRQQQPDRNQRARSQPRNSHVPPPPPPQNAPPPPPPPTHSYPDPYSGHSYPPSQPPPSMPYGGRSTMPPSAMQQANEALAMVTQL